MNGEAAKILSPAGHAWGFSHLELLANIVVGTPIILLIGFGIAIWFARPEKKVKDWSFIAAWMSFWTIMVGLLPR